MQHKGQGQMAHILDGQHNWTMLCKGLQALEWPDEELEHCQMRMPIEHYQHAKDCQALVCR